MNMIVLAIALAQFASEVGTDGGEHLPQALPDPLGGDGVLAVLGYKDQVIR